MSLEAYRKAQRAADGPRAAEYRAFSEATRKLIEAEERGRDDLKGLIEAVHANRMLWHALAADCAHPDNALPLTLRTQLVSLARWVGRHSSDVMRKRESVEPLIDLNRMMMDGLAGRAPAA